MSDLVDFKVYADEPSIIYQIAASDLPGGIYADTFGELCADACLGTPILQLRVRA